MDLASSLATVSCGSHEDLLLSIDRQLDADELSESFQVLSVEFDVVVSGALDPQWLDGAWTPFVDGEAVREVDHFVLRTVYDEHRRADFRNFINAETRKQEFVSFGVVGA